MALFCVCLWLPACSDPVEQASDAPAEGVLDSTEDPSGALTGDSAQEETSERQEVLLPTYGDGFPGEDGLIRGRLTGDAILDGGCVWLEGGEVPTPVLWPPGFSARFEPIELVGPDGEVIAREGDLIQGGGGLYDESMQRCQLGQSIAARIHNVRLARPGADGL